LAATRCGARIRRVEPLISHTDVTTVMRLIAEIRTDARAIRQSVEDDDGEEEDPEADA
jgi:hypothetical protein